MKSYSTDLKKEKMIILPDDNNFMKFVLFILLMIPVIVYSQPTPAVVENIPYLITFGKQADTKWGDDDFCQVFFFSIPKSQSSSIYIRVFDPEVYGDNDELKGNADTKTTFSVYGGKGCISNKDTRSVNPGPNMKSGNMLASKTFAAQSQYHNQWYTFGPFNPVEGEYMPEYGGYVFKVIAEGVAGDDGNLYRYYLSSSQEENVAVEGGNSFTFEYSFRLDNNFKSVSHIYPFIDDKVVSIKQTNFDWDNDGVIRIISVAKNGEKCSISGDKGWITSEHIIDPEEKNTSYDIQFIKSNSLQKNNNVVIYITNQYGEYLPFYTSPIGGVPKYKYSITVNPKKK